MGEYYAPAVQVVHQKDFYDTSKLTKSFDSSWHLPIQTSEDIYLETTEVLK